MLNVKTPADTQEDRVEIAINSHLNLVFSCQTSSRENSLLDSTLLVTRYEKTHAAEIQFP